MSDWGAVYHRVPALAAGLDLEMPPNLPRSPDQVVAAVRSGELAEEVLDARVRTVLELVEPRAWRCWSWTRTSTPTPITGWPGPPRRSRSCC